VVDAGICADLCTMNRVDVDPDQRIARVEGGAKWEAIDASTQEHGLAVTGGRMSDTGIGGLALGSGSGWLERKFGFTCDNLVKAEVVTANGRQVIASEDENADLYWGLRGGGGNFGVVTAFHLRLRPVGPILLAGQLMYPAPMAGDLLRFYRDFIVSAPDEVCGGIAFITFGQRDAQWNLHYLSLWDDPAESDRNIAYTREFSGSMKPWATGRAYLNFLGDEASSAWRPPTVARSSPASRRSGTSGTRRTCSATTRTSHLRAEADMFLASPTCQIGM
jgi:FAD binding domain-containing protein